MKKITINNLRLKNFKGIKEFTLDADSKNMTIRGTNATGKTTIVDSFDWLLFGKDSQNRSDFDIKTLKNGQVQHGLEHEVECELIVDDKPIKIKKIFAEKWVKQRGSANKEFTGHTTTYFVNDVPVKKTEFTNYISEILDEDIFRLLTKPQYFNTIHWQKRREILLTVCGDITDEDVIKSNNELKKLPNILSNRTINDHKKMIEGRRKNLNKEIEKIPTRIDEVEKGKPDVAQISEAQANQNIKILKREKVDAETEINRLKSGGQLAELQKQEAEIEGKICKLKNDHDDDVFAKKAAEKKKLNGIEEQIEEQNKIIRNNNDDVKHYEELISKKEIKIKELRQKWHSENDDRVTMVEAICPTCGQDLPQAQIDETIKTFNTNKANKLKQIQNDGVLAASDIKAKKEYIENIIKEVNERLLEIDTLIEQQKEIKNHIEVISNKPLPDEIKKLGVKRINIREQIAKLSTGDSAGIISQLQEKINAIENRINIMQDIITQFNQIKIANERIEELKNQERILAAEYEDIESQIYLIEQFIRAKVSLLEEKINSKFKQAKFQLFSEQINGGIEETCVTLVDGVPYLSANNAAQINIGLDIINTLSDYYQVAAPIFIDSAESIVDITPSGSQMIRLIVSEAHKKLTVE